jgi:hypothetical protein
MIAMSPDERSVAGYRASYVDSVRNIATAIVHLMSMQDQPKTLYIGVDDCPSDQREIVEFLARSLNVPVPPVAATSGNAERGRGKRCQDTRLRESGFVFTYPTYREGVRPS